MADLTTPLRQLFGFDHQSPEASLENRALMDRVVRAYQLDSGSTYVAALDQIYELSQDLQDRTLGGLLDRLGGTSSDQLADGLRMLEQRDAAVGRVSQAAHADAMKQLADSGVQTDAHGRVKLDADALQAAVAPGMREIRYRRALSMNPQLRDRRAFEQQDMEYLAAGVGLIETMQHRAAIRPVVEGMRDRVQGVAYQLDSAIADAGHERGRLRALGAEIDKLDDAPVAQHMAKGEISKRMKAAMDQPLRALDQVTAAEQASGPAATTTEELYERTQLRLRLMDRPQSDFLRALEEEQRGDPLPAPSAPAEGAMGVHAGAHVLHERVEARRKALGLPESAYTQVLQQLMRDEARMVR